MLGSRLIAKLIDSSDPTRDIKLAAFGSVVVASIVWLTKEQNKGPITENWVNALFGLFALVGLGGGAWTVIENWKRKNNEASQGEENKEQK
jgi:hypothetical protein